MRKQLKNIFLLLFDRVQHKALQKGQLALYNTPEKRKILNDSPLSKAQIARIQEYYKKYYGEKIPLIYHQAYAAYSGKFDIRYFPESLYIPEFERYMNIYPKYNDVFYDKNVISIIAKSAGIKTPKVFLAKVKGGYRDGNNMLVSEIEAIKLISNLGIAFVKKTVDTGGGNDCLLCNFKDGFDTIGKLSVEEIFKRMEDDFVIQEKILCHQSISNIYPKSVNTFRILTYRWKDSIFSIPAIMRIGRGGKYLDNAHQGGIFIAVKDDGVLGEKAMNYNRDEFYFHPDTNIKFDEYKIDLFPQVTEAAKRMHSLIPQIGVANWDFTIDKDGNPLLIEGNMHYGGIWIFQMAHGEGPFGEKTEEILSWMRYVKSLSPTKRNRYRFGNM